MSQENSFSHIIDNIGGANSGLLRGSRAVNRTS